MIDDENEIKQIQQRIQKAQVAQTKAEIEVDNARKTVDDLRLKLKTEYKVSTGQEIRDRLAQLEQERDTLLSEAAQKLEEAGA